MALFGYPQAQENDAERAVRAALAIQRALSDLNVRSAARGEPELSARIGLEAGSVIVEATGEVFGDAPNVAARVQAAADPGSVLITMNVQRQIAGLFVVEEQAPRELKGVAEPVQLFRVVRGSGGRRRGGFRRRSWFRRRRVLGLVLIVGQGSRAEQPHYSGDLDGAFHPEHQSNTLLHFRLSGIGNREVIELAQHFHVVERTLHLIRL